ncbi:MAG: hypothetical protein JKX93_06290 [Rhizobiaceae bacterium]|nr:hypothetical protein [Rhizobiaceae bacterium]
MIDAKPYRPSNGTEGDSFIASWCSQCTRFNVSEPNEGCEIELRALNHSIGEQEYPVEWCYFDGIPVCTAYRHTADDLKTYIPRCAGTADMFEDRDSK